MMILKRDSGIHESTCGYKPLPCAFCYKKNQNIYILRKNLEKHLEICDMRPVVCKYCNVEKLRKDIGNHEKFCDIKMGFKNAANSVFSFFSSKPKETPKNKFITCRNCQKKITLDDVNKHFCVN